MMGKLFKAFLLWFLTLASIIAIIIILLLTPTGLKIALGITKQFLPGELHYRKISGVILGPVSVTDLTYQTKNDFISIKKLKMDWQARALLKGEVVINKLKISDIRIISPENKSKKINPQALFDYLQPRFTLKIKEGLLENVRIGQTKNELPYYAKRIQFNGFMSAKHFDIKMNGTILQPYQFDAELKLTGNPAHYNFYLTANNKHMKWRAQGNGDTKHIQLTLDESSALNGILQGKLIFYWQPRIKWEIEAKAQDLDLRELNKHLPKKINASIESVGFMADKKPVFSWNIDISTQDANIHSSGKYDNLWQANWQLNIANLGEILANAHGSVISKGELSGDLHMPQTHGELKTTNLHLLNFNVENLSAKWNFDLSNRNDSSLIIHANHLAIVNAKFSQFKFDLFGKLNALDVQTQLAMNDTNITIHLTGALENYLSSNILWRGMINHFAIQSTRYGNWQLNHPSLLVFSKQQIQIGNSCFKNSQGAFCLAGNWHNKQPWSIKATGNSLPQELFVNLLAGEENLSKLTLKGLFNFKAELAGTGTHLTKNNIQIFLLPGTISYYIEGKLITGKQRGGQITGYLDAKGFHIVSTFKLSPDDLITTKLVLPKFSDARVALAQQPIFGTIKVSLAHLDIITALFPNIVIPQGKIKTDFEIGGTLSKPTLLGSSRLQNAVLDLKEYGISLKQFTFDASAQDSTIHYTISGISGGGKIVINGSTQLATPDLETKLTIKGQKVLIFKNPEYTVYASPDLELHIKGKNIAISGTILIPNATIEPVDFRNIVTLPSSNEIEFIGKTDLSKHSPWIVTGSIKLILGNDVLINTQGIYGNVAGTLTIYSKPQQPLIATGSIHIVKGTYEVAGKILMITKGSSINYLQTPLSNPSLNAEATKMIKVTAPTAFQQLSQQNVLVGANISGTLQRPKIVLFSNPAIFSQTDILSLLVLGTVVGQSSSSDISSLLDAANILKLGADKDSGGIIRKVKSSFGLSEFGVETVTALDPINTPLSRESAFVIGTRFGRRFYLRYTFNINSQGSRRSIFPTNILQVYFQLKKNLLLLYTHTTDSNSQDNSLGNGFDILYTIEK